MPKIVDHDRRRGQIVAATCATIVEDGIDATTMRRIAQRAGSTTGLITHYFADKDEVLVAALRSVHLAAAARMAAELEQGTPQDQLIAVIEQALPLDDLRRREWQVWLAFWGRAASTPALVDEQRRRYAEWVGLLRPVVRRAGADIDVDELVALVDGIGVRASLASEDLPPSRQRALVARYLHARVPA